MPKVAVVIPLYNHEAYIEAAIGSICCQTRPVDRIVVVDDGSKDRGLEIVRAMTDPRLTVVTQPNAGAHIALNRGVQIAADCDFIAILNSDDLFHPDRIQRCTDYLEAHPESDVVCTGLKLISSAGEELAPDEPKARWVHMLWNAPHEDLVDWLGFANFTKTTSNIVGRSAYLHAHPFRAYRYVHDYYFAVICALEHRLAILPHSLLSYRTHPSNTIKTSGTDAVTREVMQMNLDLMRSLAPELATSAELRHDFTRYFRRLVENHSDFRAEVFVQLAAAMIAAEPEAELAAQVGGLTTAEFPELAQPSNKSLREHHAREEYQRAYHELTRSRWIALGRTLGVRMDFLDDPIAGSDRAVSTLKKKLNNSRWVRLGRSLGAFPKTEDHA